LPSFHPPPSAPQHFDYSLVRPAGEPIRGFGGVASGPGPLRELHEACRASLDANAGAALSVTTIVDVMNLVGKCVVAGNVRRTAEIAFGDPNCDEYVDLKNYAKNPQRANHGWTSNNSVFATLGMDYEHLVSRIAANGEPGFAWLQNMRGFGRMNGVADASDWRACGGNPCLEQTLESYELCCLVETFPNRHESLDDFEATLRAALLYAKTVTLGETHWPASNRVMMRNRRIGCSVSGVAQFISRYAAEMSVRVCACVRAAVPSLVCCAQLVGTRLASRRQTCCVLLNSAPPMPAAMLLPSSRSLGELQAWCERGYATLKQADRAASERFGVPTSIKLTSVKPSGSVSLLAGATPGLHFPESRFYLRRVRLPRGSSLVAKLVAAGLSVEPAVGDEAQTLVAAFPVDAGEGIRSVHELSMWEQLSLAAFLQRHWADNQVSCTVTFDAETEGGSLASALDYFQYQLKGVSFLPRLRDSTAYAQMPYEKIDEAEYTRLMAHVRLDALADAPRPTRSAPRSGVAPAATPAGVGSAGAPSRAAHTARALPESEVVGTAVDHTPDVFCDSDRCVQDEIAQLRQLAVQRQAARDARAPVGEPGDLAGGDQRR
jgi:hypothetical protein